MIPAYIDNRTMLSLPYFSPLQLKLVDFNCPTNDPIAKNWVHPDKSLSEGDPSPPSDSKPKIRVNHMHGSRGADTVKADL